MYLLLLCLVIGFNCAGWSMKLGNLQRNGLVDGEGPNSALNASAMSQITFEETERRCPATEGKFYWHGPIVYRVDGGEEILLVAFGPCVISYRLAPTSISIAAVWDSRNSLQSALAGALCLFWGDLQIAGELVSGICRNPNNSIPILVSLNVSLNSIRDATAEKLESLSLRTALYQPFGDWVLDNKGNLIILFSTEIDESNYYFGCYVRMADGTSWNITNQSVTAVSFAGPIVSRDDKVLAFSFGDNLTFATAFAVEITTGRILWNYSLPHYLPMGVGISSDDRMLYYSQVGSCFAFEIGTWRKVWSNTKDFNGSFRSVQGGLDNRLIATESGDCCGGSRIVVLDATTGDLLWDHDFYNRLNWKGYSGGYGATVDVKGNLYIGLSYYGVACLSPNGDVLFNHTFLDSNWTVPYSFQPLLVRNRATFYFVTFWAGDTIAEKTRQNFLSSFKYEIKPKPGIWWGYLSPIMLLEIGAMAAFIVLFIYVIYRYKSHLNSWLARGKDDAYEKEIGEDLIANFNSDSFSIDVDDSYEEKEKDKQD